MDTTTTATTDNSVLDRLAPSFRLARIARRRINTPVNRGVAHLVPVGQGGGPEWQRIAGISLCGSRPRRSFAHEEAPEWERTCPRCEAAGRSAGLLDR